VDKWRDSLPGGATLNPEGSVVGGGAIRDLNNAGGPPGGPFGADPDRDRWRGDPRPILSAFVKEDVHNFLHFAVLNYAAFAPPPLWQLQGVVTEAWEEEIEPLFDEAGRLTLDADLDQLKIHGLSGLQLRMKMTCAQAALDWGYVTLGVPRILRRHITLPRPLTDLGRKIVAPIIQWGAEGLDNVLGSLSAVVPFVGAIEEVKRHVEWLAEGGRRFFAVGSPERDPARNGNLSQLR